MNRPAHGRAVPTEAIVSIPCTRPAGGGAILAHVGGAAVRPQGSSPRGPGHRRSPGVQRRV